MPIPQIEVRSVRGGRDLHRFVRFPWRIYARDPNWVPPLMIDVKKMFQVDKHPFHRHAEVAPFLAYREGELVGRIAAIVNHRHNEFHHEKTGFFGFFESVDDVHVSGALLEKAASWVAERGMERLRGPANFSTNEECAMLVDGFDSAPAIMMPYNPPYYPGLIEAAGLSKVKDLVAYYWKNEGIPERWMRMAEKIMDRESVTIRSVNMKRYSDEILRFREVYNRAWERNWGFVPMTDEEIAHMAKELKPAINRDLILFLEKGDEPIGFALCLPDANQAIRHANGRLFPFGLLKILYHARKIRTARVLVLGILPEHRGRGLDILLYLQLIRNGARHGILEGEFSWMLEDNVAIRRPMEKMGGRVYKTYRFYERALP